MSALIGESRTDRREAIQLDGRPVGHLPPHGRRKTGICFVPEERLGHAAVPDNVTDRERHPVGPDAQGPVAQQLPQSAACAARYASDVVAQFGVKTAGVDHAARSLSGGNLQKVRRRPGDHAGAERAGRLGSRPGESMPGAAAFIQEALIELARGGTAVLVISQDLDELFAISDRIAVIANGRLSTADPVDDLTIEQIGLRMGGQAHGRTDAAGAAEPAHA